MGFKDKLEAWERPLTLYEIIPPPQSAPREEVADTASYIKHLLADHDIDAINVPDVRNEDRNGQRLATFLKKRDARQFALTLADVFGGHVDLIVNHVTVHEPAPRQEEWFDVTFTKFGIPNVVLVGGESSTERYPGPGVNAAADLARAVAERTGTNACLGAITIPTRRRDDLDEPDRMLRKIEHGIDFFTSQVIYEADPARRLLRDYDAACKEAGVAPKPVFLSFAPIAGRKDIEFLEWLGVDIPKPTQQWLLAPHGNVLDRSARVAEHTLHEILAYCERREVNVPIGVNVEHIMRYSFEASEVLLDRLTSLVDWHELQRAQRSTRSDPS